MDEMKNEVNSLNIKHSNIVEKYGGFEFLNKFASLVFQRLKQIKQLNMILA